MLFLSCSSDCPEETAIHTWRGLNNAFNNWHIYTMYGNDIDINKLKTILVLDTTIAHRID